MHFQAKTQTKPKRRGISYGRVSTFDQAFHKDGSKRDDASPEAQRSRCADHIKYLNTKNGGNHELMEHISDDGFSGKNTKRPGYQKMWNLIESNSVDFVVTVELSRISRSVLDFLELVAHCENHKVDLVIIGLELDTSNAFGRVMVIILVALAQFEREMTSQRVKENALNRLLKDGKINGAAEILGLDRDPNSAGHFLINEEELIKVEKILQLFLRFSSKKKVLAEARALGLTGKKGRELTKHMLDSLMDNVKWRYRGLWYANKENENVNSESLPENKRYQIVELPHGVLIQKELLEKVQDKLKETYDKKKRTGKNNYVYLLSHILEYQDGSKYFGSSGKDWQYFYYYCKGPGPKIRCDKIEEAVISRIKTYFKGNEIFKKLVESAVKRRINDLPRIDQEISRIQSDLKDIEDENRDLREQLRDKENRHRSGFMTWLEEEVSKLQERKALKQKYLDDFTRARADLIQKSGLESLEATASEFIERFKDLTNIEKRTFIERMISKIVIKEDNQLELHVMWEPKRTGVTRTTTSSVSDCDGGVLRSLTELFCRPYQDIDIIEFKCTPIFRNQIVLHQKYIVEKLSLKQISEEFLVSKGAIGKGLIDFGIPLRDIHKPHGNRSQLPFGMVRRVEKEIEFKKEQRIILAIRGLKEKGLSLREIC